MRNLSIREFENFSHIKAHTIRVWEKRYAIFKPRRSKGNFRSYTLEELKFLFEIALLTKNGFKISHVSKMDSTLIDHTITSLKMSGAMQLWAVNQLILCMLSSNIEEFEAILDDCLLSVGVDQTIQNVIIPFLEKAQILSYKDNSHEVHFVVPAVRKKLILGIENSKHSLVERKTALLFLPKGEHYDLLLLYMTYIIKNNGLTVLYLGTNISAENLQMVIKEKRPDCLYTYIASKKIFNVDEFANYLNQYLPQSKLFVAYGENKILQKNNSHNVEFFHYKDVFKTLATN